MTEREMEVRRLYRLTIVRLCPEVPDYDAFAMENEQVLRAPTYDWHSRVTDAEVIATAQRDIAALWARSLSDERSEEAPHD